MEDASGTAKVKKNGWTGKISLHSFGCSCFSRDSSLARNSPPFPIPYMSFLWEEEQAGLLARGQEGLLCIWGPPASSWVPLHSSAFCLALQSLFFHK